MNEVGQTQSGLRIAFVSHQWPPLNLPAPDDAVHLATWEIARRIARSCEVTVYSGRHASQAKEETFENVRLRRIARLESRIYPRPGISSYLYNLPYILQIARDVRREGYDIVHLQNFSQHAAIMRQFVPKSKIVLHMHNRWLTRMNPKTVVKRLRSVDFVFGCSNYVTTAIVRTYPQMKSRCRTIYNGVGPDAFPGEGVERPVRNGGTKHLLFLGRISPEKGVHVLLEAFHEVLRQCAEAELDIVGPDWPVPYESLLASDEPENFAALKTLYDGTSYRDQVRKQVADLGLGDRVRFCGPIPHSETLQRFVANDLLVNPSFSESLGMTVLEAMASGLPVIATRTGGVVETVVDGTTGLLVSPGDVHGLAEAILRLIRDDHLRASMGQAGSTRVRHCFSWDGIAKDVFAEYSRLSCPATAKSDPEKW